MARVITIAGANRTGDIKIEEFSVEQVLTWQEDNCNFTVKSGSKPSAGQEIIVTDGGVKSFAGIIDDVKEDPRAPGITFYKCQAVDYTYLLDKKLVVETYASMAADLIAKDIITKYCSGFTSTHVSSGAPTVESIVFDYKRPSECLKELAAYIGWDWYVDYNKDLWFFNPANLAMSAPVTITAATAIHDLKHNIDADNLRNRVYVRGGTMLSGFVTYEYVADGQQRAWILPYKPHSITLAVAGGAPITPGIENIDDETTKTWMMNYQEKMVRLATGQPDVAAGAVVAFTFKFDIDVITMVENLVSQAAMAAVQGGDGVYEHVIVDDSFTTLEAAEAAGNQDLTENANPQVKGSFQTEITGWAPGQLLTFNLPERGIANTFIIQKVTLEPIDAVAYAYRVEYGGRLIGLPDFLRALVSAQQKKKLNETTVLHKFTYGQETVEATDVAELTARTPPYYCGDADAYCGFVECSGFFQIVAADGLGILTGYEGPDYSVRG